jgi:hypothetical protein
MGDDLDTLCGRISLIGGEKLGIKILEGDVAADIERGKRCLVGRIGDEKKVYKDAFKNMLASIWRIVGTVTFNEVQDNVWLFEFTDEDDKKRVMDGRPWSFDRQILILNDFDGSVLPAQVQFTHSPFWIQVHDMPLICMNKGIGTKIGESLRELEDVDVARDGSGWGRSLRLRVNIDLRNPLERGRSLSMGGKEYWVTFRYERLPLFCFNCRRVVHGVKGCTVKRSQRRHDDEGPKPWGVWLRADEPRRRPSGGVGGEFFKEEGRRTDDATWRKQSMEKERTGAYGNPSQCSNSEQGKDGARGDPYLVGKRGDAAHNGEFEGMNFHMESYRNALDRKQGEGSRQNKGKEKKYVHVEQETVDSWESSHAPML